MPLSRINANSIADGTVVAAEIANDAITSDKILNSAVTSAKIADANITTAKIADANITSAKLASSIETPNITITGGSISNAVLQNRTRENVTVNTGNANGNVNFDVSTQQVLIFTANSSANVTLNIRGNSTVALNDVLASNQAISIAFAMTNGPTARIVSAVQIDGVGVTPRYQGGTPTSGTANVTTFYTFNTIKTAANTYLVFGSQTAFE